MMLIRVRRRLLVACPIPLDRQHVSDFGRITSFDMALVRIEVATGSSAGARRRRLSAAPASCRALVALINDELGPAARRAGRAADHRSSGTRCTTDRGPATRSTVDGPFRCSDGAGSTVAGDERHRHGAVGPARQVARRARRRPVGRAVPRPTCRCTRAAAGPTPPGSATSSLGYVARGFGASRCASG